MRARQGAQEVADDAGLRKIALSYFFTVGGQAIETIPGEPSERQQARRLPTSGSLLTRESKGRTILVEVLT